MPRPTSRSALPLLAIVGGLVALSAGPQRARASLLPGNTNGIPIVFQSLTRHYNVHVPPGYDGSVAVPLVLDFHGYTSGPSEQAGLSGMQPLADNYGFIIVFPEGYGSLRSWNAGTCCGAALAAGLDDVGLARAIVADVEANANVDHRRVYATGLSNGGMMSHRLACEAWETFAAMAPVAAPLTLAPFTTCQPARPVPLLHFAGLTDVVVPYNGGVSGVFSDIFLASSPASNAYWVGEDGCTDAPVVEDLGNGATCESHTACTDGVEVGFCSIHGTGGGFYGHVLYSNSDGVNVAQRVWAFLSRFMLPTDLPTTTTSTSSSSTTSTTNSTTSTLPVIAACGPAPATGCVAAGRATLLVNEKTPGSEKLDLVLKRLQPAVAQAQFGNPVGSTTNWAVCLYDQSNGLVGQMGVDRAGAMCGAKPCWKAVGSLGYAYADKQGAADGIQKLVAKGGVASKGSVTVKGRNHAPLSANLPTGVATALQGATAATAQVLTSDAGCFGVTLPTVKTAAGNVFKAVAP